MNTNHCAYESQHEPKNIKVQGLRGRWDVCLHAVEKNGTREYWWVLNADGVDGEEGYWTTRKAKGESSTSATLDGETPTTPSRTSKRNSPTETGTTRPTHIGPDTRGKNEKQRAGKKKCATTS